MTAIAILKTGALGDVLRTTSILPGLHGRSPGLEVTWVTAPGAVDLVRTHPQVARVLSASPKDADAVAALEADLDGPWDRVLSFDDEEPLCRLASALDGPVSGAYLTEAGERAYTPDVGPWFDMGLLSVHGKERADELKVLNRRSHPEIYAEMLGIEMGRPRLELPDEARAFAERFRDWHGLGDGRSVIGLNTGAGGRWESKKLSVERSVELASLVANERGGVDFVVLGGPDEAERNAAILAGIAALGDVARVFDGGTDNPLLEFAALVDLLDLLVTSDSLALHMAVARRVPVVAFFAPTSAAEIELYGDGEKVRSTAPDYCSYRPDADTSTVTAERIAAAVTRTMERRASAGPVEGGAA